MNDQLVAETCTWQHTTLTTDKHPCPRWDSNPQSQQASGRRPTPLRPSSWRITNFNKHWHELITPYSPLFLRKIILLKCGINKYVRQIECDFRYLLKDNKQLGQTECLFGLYNRKLQKAMSLQSTAYFRLAGVKAGRGVRGQLRNRDSPKRILYWPLNNKLKCDFIYLQYLQTSRVDSYCLRKQSEVFVRTADSVRAFGAKLSPSFVISQQQLTWSGANNRQCTVSKLTCTSYSAPTVAVIDAVGWHTGVIGIIIIILHVRDFSLPQRKGL